MTEKKIAHMAALYQRLRRFLRVQPGKYCSDCKVGFRPDHLGCRGCQPCGGYEIMEYNQSHTRQTSSPKNYLIWEPKRKDLQPPSFEQFLEAYYGNA